MMRRNFTIVVAVCILVGAPLFASALTIDDIQAQIKALLAKVVELTAQLNALQGQPASPPTVSVQAPGQMPMRHHICAILTRNLSLGVQGEDVASLQEFLRSEGYLTASATGYFGSMTRDAVARWQAAQGVSAVGSLGPLSRERIRIWCGMSGEGSGATGRFFVEPQRGSAPLTVTFKTNVQLANSRFVADAGEYKVVFGDGGEYTFPCTGDTPWCYGPHTLTHTYTSNGTYTVQLVHFGYFGPPGPSGIPSTVVATATIYVGPVACTKEYMPVCGSHTIVCITTPCNPIQQTYSNRCMMQADGATFLYEGACRDSSADPANDPRCRAWYDGCNNCSRETPNGPAMCTLRACVWQAPAYCTAYFDSATNKPPVISGFSGPTTLSVNETGTWAVNASDPENGQLTYSITWGDEHLTPMPMATYAAREAFVQTTSFTHAYSSAGTYTITVVVRDSSGQEAKTSTTVRVGAAQVYCTMEYVPVCGQPPEPACRRTPPYCMLPTPGPQTYGNRCLLNASGATFLYEGRCQNELIACPADARQCPNGQWVGRTGTNCEFVCPGT
ncbi:hypothetical protein A3A39_02865 [Candidatus Kaiserbacteria bacterium RIFCSPLOWO2_01_FULL_54_13]|uniref:PKD domain-containing protein n=1 Tax=Candidatus Kaiserbacteria bacterium RIFCSPLOWO2_01_FULL_54_13 TaxID=1798512 RepID=A0A1F6F2U9_9BACT|nr:MAG: hypothetical protein A3A39_02865 [Candidatus Kaiserbacteria bacterium RIFCSPLOWO2_01_FULL_54_13]